MVMLSVVYVKKIISIFLLMKMIFVFSWEIGALDGLLMGVLLGNLKRYGNRILINLNGLKTT